MAIVACSPRSSSLRHFSTCVFCCVLGAAAAAALVVGVGVAPPGGVGVAAGGVWPGLGVTEVCIGGVELGGTPPGQEP